MAFGSDLKVLLLEGIHPIAQEKLQQSGFQVDLLAEALSEEQLVQTLPKYHALGIRSKTQVTQSVLKACPDLLVVGAFCIGTNQIDLQHANTLGIPVFNAPYSNTRSVAEMVIAEMIFLARKLGDRNIEVHKGLWSKVATGSHEVRGKTLGIIGYGHIGSQVSVLAEALGMSVVFYDIVRKLPLGNSKATESLSEVLQAADFVTLHVPQTNETKDMIGQAELRKMRKGAHLINASRGNVVVISALAEAIRSGHLGGAAIDVFPQEPKSNKDRFESELQGLPNVILSPHIGGSTEEAQVAIGEEVSDSLNRYLLSGMTSGAVNFPIVELPVMKGAHRIVHIHKNVPGVLGEVNGVVSALGANIQAQFLSTDPNIGYLVMDMELGVAPQVADRLSKMKTTIKTRVLY